MASNSNYSTDYEPRLRAIWNQHAIPVVLRRDGKGQKIRMRLPFSEGNREWLSKIRSRGSKPRWIGGDGTNYWELPKSWFTDLVNRTLETHGAVYVIQPYREQEICARACMEATGHECQCSCMGANHGAGIDNSWFEISEAFATRWQDRELACRLMLRTRDNPGKTQSDEKEPTS